MKRRELLKHLENNNCRLLREGGNHSIYENSINKKRTAIPRHNEIVEFTAKQICKQLEIPLPN
jgi:mRNA interferase HicA